MAGGNSPQTNQFNRISAMPASQAMKQSRSVGLALNRLRLGVAACCWIIGLALALQVVIWSLVSYTEMRYASEGESVVETETPAVVTAESPRQQRIREAREAEMGIELTSTPEVTPVEPVYSTTDGIFATLVDSAGGIGRFAMLALLPLMMVGVVLSAGSATPGVDRVVSALIWGLIAAAFILPFGSIGGGTFGMPWDHGGLSTYEHMTGWVDRVNADDPEQAASSLVFHARLCLLPIACIVAITLVGLRFCSGVEAGVLAAESMRLDPALEREAANISPSSLHSGRSSSAFSQALRSDDDKSDKGPSARSVSPGELPQRLI